MMMNYISIVILLAGIALGILSILRPARVTVDVSSYR